MNSVLWGEDFVNADRIIREVVEDYAEFDNIVGWDIVDEPYAEKFPILAAIVNAFRRYAPEHDTVINLDPFYGNRLFHGQPATLDDYIAFVEQYLNTVNPNMLSYDHYHFLGRFNDPNCSLTPEQIEEHLSCDNRGYDPDRDSFFENISVIRRLAAERGIDPMLIVLLSEHNGYRNLTYAELSWEVNMCLVYGMKRISYYTYWMPVDDFAIYENAMCDVDGTKLRHYYDVQKINREILPAGRHLFDTASEAVFHIGEPELGSERFTSYGVIEKIEGENGVIGFFADGSIYLVNRDFKNANTFKLHTTEKLTKMTDGIFYDLESDTVTLDAGAAVLLKA